MSTLLADTLAVLRYQRRGLLIFHLFFAGLALSALSPLFSWALAGLAIVTGQAAITTGGLIEFLLSPGGWLWLLASATTAGFILVLQQAGMTVIAATTGAGDYRIALSALWALLRRGRALSALAAIQVSAHLLLALPFVLAMALSYLHWLAPYEGHLLRLERLPVIVGFTAIALCALGLLSINGWLYLRWALAIPLLVVERLGAREALRHSTELMHGRRAPVAAAVLGCLGVVLALPVLFTGLFAAAAGPVVDWLPERLGVVMPAVLAALAAYLLLAMVLAFLSIAAYSVLLYAVYRRAREGAHRLPPPALPRRARRLAWTVEALVVIAALAQGGLVLQSFEPRDRVTVTAHRGSAHKAPENTLSAIRQAIEDGADYIEVDVRMTADGTLVLWHDADMRRVFGLDHPLSTMPYKEARQLDAGSWFDPAFAEERIATLEEAVRTVRGRARLYLDLKPADNAPQLAAEVIALLRRHDSLDDVVIAAAQWDVLREVRRLAPAVKTTLLAQFVVGPFWDDDFDVLGLRANRVTPATVARAHREGHELHVWTVNRRAAMARFIDMGVDNIITDRPDVLAKLLRERERMSETELLVTKLRSWLR